MKEASSDLAKQKKSFPKRKILVYAACALLVVGLILSNYLLYRDNSSTKNEVASLQQSVDELEKQNSEDQIKIDEINQKLATAEAALADSGSNVEEPTYKITLVNKARDPTNPYQDNGSEFLYLNIDIENTSSTDGYISVSTFKLKDAENHTFEPISSPQPAHGFEVLTSQSLVAGEKVRGSIHFVVPKTTRNFILYYGDVSIEIKT